MLYVNTELLNRVPECLKGVMEYYPDVLLFKLNQIQYTHLWQLLSSTRYIYTNGYEIRPTNWFMYAFESFKGWLGFDNHCHPEIISYTLNKLAYFGYMNQFSQPEFSLVTGYSISPEICCLAASNYKDLTTAQLQNELVKAYFKIEPYLSIEYSFQRLHFNHRYGEIWAKVGLLEMIPLLDPQDNSLIAEVISAIDQKEASVTEFFFLKNSRYAQTAAQYYYDKAENVRVPYLFLRLMWSDPRPGYIAQALLYDPEIAKRNPHQFIEYHLERKEYEKAFNLLASLKDTKQILKFFWIIPEKVRNSLIQKDTPIAAILAQYYIEKEQYTEAQQIFSNIEELSPNAAFAIAIKGQHYTKAYEMFKRLESTSTLSKSERKKLAIIFFNAADYEYKNGKINRDSKKWKDAEQYYLRSLEQQKAAYHLNPSEENLENVSIYKRLYALLLIDADIDLHKSKDSDIATIQKAITLLKECNPNNEIEQHYKKIALAKGFMRRVDTLCEKVAFIFTPGDYFALKEHKVKHQQELTVLIKTLEELVTLLKGTQDETLRIYLGKACYLLADVQSFFDINTSDINQHYNMAMEAVPDNPFYILRVAEVFKTETAKLRPKGVIKLKSMGYNGPDYCHWSDERWAKKEDMIGAIKDIHQPPIESTNPSVWSLGF